MATFLNILVLFVITFIRKGGAANGLVVYARMSEETIAIELMTDATIEDLKQSIISVLRIPLNFQVNLLYGGEELDASDMQLSDIGLSAESVIDFKLSRPVSFNAVIHCDVLSVTCDVLSATSPRDFMQQILSCMQQRFQVRSDKYAALDVAVDVNDNNATVEYVELLRSHCSGSYSRYCCQFLERHKEGYHLTEEFWHGTDTESLYNLFNFGLPFDALKWNMESIYV